MSPENLLGFAQKTLIYFYLQKSQRDVRLHNPTHIFNLSENYTYMRKLTPKKFPLELEPNTN